MKNVTFAVVALLFATVVPAQDRHQNQNGQGHEQHGNGNGFGHTGGNNGHHGNPPPPICENEGYCPPPPPSCEPTPPPRHEECPGGAPVPEPGTMILLGTGLAGIAALKRRRAAAKALTQV